MTNEDQTMSGPSRRYLEFTCPTCKRRVRVLQEDPAKLPRCFPFCSERCKLIDLGAWLDAGYRIPSKPDEESDHPAETRPPGGQSEPNE
jgi:endogenous inhibitor of DNA gyrase (YacG/DUF329 family)